MNAATTRHIVTTDNATNWEESIFLQAGRVAYAHSVDEIVEVLTNAGEYPGPVRAIGSRHSTTHCGVSDGGTLLIMRRMDRILEIDRDALTVSVQAGALYIDVARALEAEGLQFYVNVEIGNLSMGAAASTGTKDASMPGELGQVCSYAIGIKMVLPSGELLEIGEVQPELLQAARSSYGLFGVIYEVTFRVRPLRAMAVHHRTYTVDEFARELPRLREQGVSIMYYLFPFTDTVSVEFRRYLPDEAPASRWMWRLRNFFWKTFAPLFCHLATRLLRNKKLRYSVVDNFYRIVQLLMNHAVRSRRTYAGDQLIRYPETKGASKYTFSIWAFPEADIVPTMRAYYAFCRDYYAEHGYRCDMLNVGYRIAGDRNSLFSYSFDGTVMTLDPVCTNREPGWDDFLRAYNRFCTEHNGAPLFNQSKWLTRDQVAAAFGERVARFAALRRRFDPDGRLLNAYFRELLGGEDERPGDVAEPPAADAVSSAPTAH